MKKYLYLGLLLILACGDQKNDPSADVQQDEKLKISTSKAEKFSQTITDHNLDPGTRMTKAIKIDGHLIDIEYDNRGIQKLTLPRSINSPLRMRYFDHFTTALNIDSLKKMCSQIDYKNDRHQYITLIAGKIKLNPFTELDLVQAYNRYQPPKLVLKVSHAFQPISIYSKIVSSYLADVEIIKLNKWLSEKFQPDNQYMEIKTHITLNALSDLLDKSIDDWRHTTLNEEILKLPEPILEMGRLICGILNHEASITFVLTDKEGKTLNVVVDDVNFGYN